MTRQMIVRPVEISKPLLYFNFNNDFVINDQLLDVMGVNNGTIVGSVGTGSTGRVGEAFEFTSVSTRLSVPDNASFTPHLGASGVSTWTATVYVRSPVSTQGIAFSKWEDATAQKEFIVGVGTGGGDGITFTYSDGSTTSIIGSDRALPKDVWVHVAVVWDASITTDVFERVKVYLNGQRIGTTVLLDNSAATKLIADSTAALSLGARTNNDAGQFLDGFYDEAIWFPTTLSDAQIAELSARSLRRIRAYGAPPVTDYSIWWSARNTDGAGNTTVTSDPRIQTLIDQGSLGVDASQATASKRPILRQVQNPVLSKLNDYRAFRPGIKFDGIDDILDFSSQTFGDFTVCVVTKPTTPQTSSTLSPLLLRSNNTNPQGVFWLGNGTSELTNEVISINFIDAGGSRGSGTADANLTIPNTKTNVIVAALENTTSTYRLNGVGTGPPQIGDTLGGLDSGANQSLVNIDALFGRDTAPFYNNALLFELFIFPRKLSEQEILAMESWVAEEYPGVETSGLAFASAAVPDAGFPDPFAYYSFNNADLVNATLLEPFRGLHGTLINSPTTGVAGQQGQAISFTGASSQRIEIDDNALFQFEVNTEFSISAWFSTSSTSQWLISKIRTDTVIERGWGIFMTAGGNLQVMLGEPTVGRIVTTDNAFNDGTFHNVVVTYDGSNSAAGIVINVDGEPVATTVTLDTDPSSISNPLPVQIGSQDPATSIPGYWTGLIDETGLWSVKLT